MIAENTDRCDVEQDSDELSGDAGPDEIWG